MNATTEPTTAKEPTQILRLFNSGEDARTYRHVHGTGGWIFVPENEQGGMAVLFPPDVSPTGAMTHPITRGRSGTLIGAA